MGQETSDQVAYRKLVVWQKAHILAINVYEDTKQFPKEELFGLTSQMRRCAVSVPANIVEGYSRKTIKEKLNFFNIARGSLSELEYYLELSCELGYLDSKNEKHLAVLRAEVGRLLNGFIRSF